MKTKDQKYKEALARNIPFAAARTGLKGKSIEELCEIIGIRKSERDNLPESLQKELAAISGETKKNREQAAK